MSDGLYRHPCGCTHSQRFGVEYVWGSRYRYDGVSVWVCDHGAFGRWCGQRLEEGEVEPPFCQGKLQHPKEGGE